MPDKLKLIEVQKKLKECKKILIDLVSETNDFDLQYKIQNYVLPHLQDLINGYHVNISLEKIIKSLRGKNDN